MYPQDAGFVAIEEIHAAAIKNMARLRALRLARDAKKPTK